MNPFDDRPPPPRPLAAPPASAPPSPPPLSDSDSPSVDSRNGPSYSSQHNMSSYSYQNSSNIYQSPTARSAPVPTITNYGVSPATTIKKEPDKYISTTQKFQHSGNARLRPNTGQTNDEFGGIGSLKEVVTRLRWMTIGATIAAIVWEGFAFPGRLLINAWLQPARVVLAAYLGFFCLFLLGVELNAPLRDNFGILYQPLGRSFLLFLMSTLCFGVLETWWEFLLGTSFLACGAGYVYAYVKYPEYRRWQDHNDINNDNSQVWQSVGRAMRRRRTNPWAHPYNSNLASDWKTVQQESQSLLHHF